MRFPGWIRDRDNLARRASVTATNPTDETNYPVHNLIKLPVSQPFRMNNRATNRLYWTFPGPVSIDCLFLVGYNLSPTASLEVRAGATFDAGTFTQAMSWRRRKAFVHLSAAEQYQYWAVDIVDEANEYGFLEFGYSMLGILTVADFGYAPDWPFADRLIQLAADTSTGTPDVRTLAERQRLGLAFANLDADELETLRTLFLNQLGGEDPLFFVPDVAVNEGFFGRFAQDEFERGNPNQTFKSGEIALLEDPSGLIIQKAMPIFRAGEDLPTEATFSRASTALYKNQDLQLVEAAVDEVRNSHWLDYGKERILIEPQRTNAWAWAEVLNDASYSPINASVTANVVSEPLATPAVKADKLVEASDVNTTHFVQRDLAAHSDNTLQAVSFFIKAGERTVALIRVYDKSTNASGFFYLNLLTGQVIGTPLNWVEGTDFQIEKYYSGWWRVLLSFDSLSGAGNGTLRIYLSNNSPTATYDGDGASGLYLWGFQHEVDQSWPSSYIPTISSAVTRSADDLSMSWTFGAQPCTFYFEATEIGGRYISSARTLQLAQDGTNTAPWILIYNLSAAFRFQNGIASGYVTSQIAMVDLGHDYELRGGLSPSGSVQLGISDNGGGESLDAESTDLELQVPSVDPVLQFGASTTGGNVGLFAFRKLALYPGVQSLDFMRKL